MKSFIVTKYGFFEVTDNGSNGTILSVYGNKVFEFPTISWWDKDNIEKALEKNMSIWKKVKSVDNVLN